VTQLPQASSPRARRSLVPRWRRESLRTNLWVVPTLMVAVVVVLFAVTYELDRLAREGTLALPAWLNNGGADAARQILIGIAAAVITVAGVVFSITILALQLASQQFGPRMLRSFIRDLGTQISLGAFVATFVYSVLTMASVASAPAAPFVPHVSISIALLLMLTDLGVLIYFINHVATSIQLTSVVAGIARDFRTTLEDLRNEAAASRYRSTEVGVARGEPLQDLDRQAASVPAGASGFLQAVGHDHLVQIAVSSGAVIRLLHRAGHFVVQGQPLALVWPSSASNDVSDALHRAHIVGPSRTMTQDPSFAIDQLVEVAIRALSPAVNDTFTALNCIDWLGDCLCRVAREPLPDGVYRDPSGTVRLIDPVVMFDRLVKGAVDKIRQAGRGMPAVLIRQLENLQKLAPMLGDSGRRALIDRQADLILEASEESVAQASDRMDVRRAYDAYVATARSTEPASGRR
jgi:uncharacterized membrane protein